MDEKELYARKAALLKRALATADNLDAETVREGIVRPVFELGPGQQLAEEQYDGMEDLLGHDTLETDWDLEDGVPPPGFWSGTHTRYGERVPGFTEEEYRKGERW